MKKFISLLLTAMILITNISLSNVKAEKVYKYVLTQDPANEGDPARVVLETDDAGGVLDKIQNISDDRDPQFSQTQEYTLTLNADLVIPLDDGGRLKVLNLNRDFKQLTIEGKNHTISAVESDKEDDCFIKLRGGDITTGGLYFRNLTIDGVNKYNLINGDWSRKYIDLDNCTLKNAKEWALYSINSQVTVKKSKITNCGINRSNYFAVYGGSLLIEDSVSTNNRGTAYFYYCTDAKITNSVFKNNESDFYAPLNFVKVGNLLVKGGSIVGNKGSAGAIIQDQVKTAVYDGLTIADNEGTDQGAMTIVGYDFTIKNCTITGNKGEESSAIRIKNYSYEHVKGLIENSIISKNIANNLGSLFLEDNCDLTINNTVFSDNKARVGGAIAATSNKDSFNITINGCKFINNYAGDYGGAIYTDDYIYEFTRLGNDPNFKPYTSLEISNDVVFEGNRAGLGFFNPPEKYKDFKNLGFSKCSLEGKLLHQNAKGEWEHVRSLINNYDISYINKISTVTYDPNNGSSRVIVFTSPTEIDNNNPNYTSLVPKEYTSEIKSNKETKFTNGDKHFTSWNTEANGKGTTYMPGELATIRGNLYLYAQWYDPGVTLTLNENYRGGKITDKNVFRGDSFDEHLYKAKRRGHTFKGWSYNKKHLNKVHRDDIIEEPITVYAIWDEVEEEEEIKALKHKAYIFGYPDGTVRPNGEITRAEAAAMLARLLEIESIGSADKPMFPDTPSDWYNKAINAVVQRDIMKGYPDGTFKPNDAITRAEFTQMIATIDNKAYGVAPFADVVGHWAERPIGSEYQAGRIAGYPDGMFRPDNHITRAEAAVILNKIFERNFDAMSLLKCKNLQMIKYFTDLDASFWGYNDMVEATNTHEYIRRTQNRVEENWLLIK